AEVRARYTGEVIYAANWSEAFAVPFWDAVDAVGVDAYFPVARRADPTRLDLYRGWLPWRTRLADLARRAEKPVLITELGYRSADGNGMHPWDYAAAAPVDTGEQSDLA